VLTSSCTPPLSSKPKGKKKRKKRDVFNVCTIDLIMSLNYVLEKYIYRERYRMKGGVDVYM